jgi:hypothetical protein
LGDFGWLWVILADDSITHMADVGVVVFKIRATSFLH